MEYFDIYNRFGEKTGEVIERGEAHRSGVCHRVVHLWLINEKHEILIQQRSATKDSGANLWYVSVGGHIEAGESIESTLIRETQEELGLDISEVTDRIKYLFTFKDCKVENEGAFIDHEFYDVFALKMDFDLSEITLQPEEVQAVKFVSFETFKQIVIKKDPTFWHHESAYKMLLIALEELEVSPK